MSFTATSAIFLRRSLDFIQVLAGDAASLDSEANRGIFRAGVVVVNLAGVLLEEQQVLFAGQQASLEDLEYKRAFGGGSNLLADGFIGHGVSSSMEECAVGDSLLDRERSQLGFAIRPGPECSGSAAPYNT